MDWIILGIVLWLLGALFFYIITGIFSQFSQSEINMWAILGWPGVVIAQLYRSIRKKF